jgi:hypothetical protein
MTNPSLSPALRAAADGLCALEAATGADHRSGVLAGPRRLRPIHPPGSAAIDWEAAIIALGAGELPSSTGERRDIVELADSQQTCQEAGRVSI